MNREIKLDMLELFDMEEDVIERGEAQSRDIAIVGLAVKAGQAENAEELWNALCNGEDMTRELPQKRAEDADAFAQYLGKTALHYARESYLERIDEFSPSFFRIPPKDAALIDPAQRLFLQAAWSALEDAGLSKQRLARSETGVFVGYTAESNGYSELLAQSNPEYADRAIAGKVNSIIASRLSYYLNLRGPAVMIDTACSSSLVAVHFACNSIRSGECEMAVVGSVKYSLIPEKSGDDGEISVTSSDGQTRTFDVHSDGTNPGEGIGVVVLKRLDQAIEDKDRIYAVIKGSAINQDGASVGITAPNAEAQEDVIVKAWENAGIDPEKISYIEAHGTATKLGDPVEISGIERAFRRYTDKKQFCAIGSLKTNLGHLDCAAGIMGLIKCVLALSHRELPPHLNFTSPNREIDFIHSPVYINDTRTSWQSESERLCGVSSFGLSGTNCHVVLQEYVQEQPQMDCLPMILPLSAEKKPELLQMAESFAAQALSQPQQLANMIFTAAMNKSDYAVRAAIVIESIEDIRLLPQLIEKISAKGAENQALNEQAYDLVCEIRNSEDLALDAMRSLCRAYMEGAEVDWFALYEDLPVRIVSISGYPMQKERCWEVPKQQAKPILKTASEPLIDVCITSSPRLHVYSSMLSEQTHSEVREHIIGERNVLAGTVYVEMLRSAASKMLHTEHLRIDNLVFLSAMIFEKEEIREVQTILYQSKENECEATIQSRTNESEDWIIHIQAKVSAFEEAQPLKIDVSTLLNRLGKNVMDETVTTVDQMVTTGPRWKVQKGIWIGDGEAVTLASIEEEYAHELNSYHLYPSMLDAAVNCSSVLNGDAFCLPYYYGSLQLYKRMPKSIYSHTVKNMESSSKDGEINVFDIVIFDENGEVLATVKDYAMKKTSERQKKQFFAQTEPLLRTTEWIRDTTVYRAGALSKSDESVLLVSKNDGYSKRLYQTIKAAAKDALYEMVLCDWEGKRTDRKTYVYPEDRERIVEYFEEMENRSLSRVVFVLPKLEEPETYEVLSAETESLTRGFFNIIYALASNKALGNLSVDLLIPTEKDRISPIAMAIAGMGKSIFFEYSRLRLRCVLFSDNTTDRRLIDELSYNYTDYMVWLKGDERYVQQLSVAQTQPIENFALSKNGTYLITGGAGGIGLVLAQALAQMEPSIRLLLLGRSKLLPQNEWKNAQEERYQRLSALCSTAASVSYLQCDVADEEKLTNALADVGHINGIIHAAGLPGGGFVLKRRWEDFFDVLAPKVFGTWNLVKLAERHNMEFIVLFSSYATVLSVAGQSDYIGANSFMDAYVQHPNDCVKVINWSGWRECGMALANGVDMVNSPVQFMSNAEATEAFKMAMANDERHVLIGKFNYAELAGSLENYSKVIRFDNADLELLRSNSDRKKNNNKNYDITVHGKETALTPTEHKVAQAWAKILGVREIDYQDKFLEVGGDSLSATYLQKEIESIYPNVMDITDVFVYPTIEQMATFIDSKTAVPEKKQSSKVNDTEQMRKLLEQLASGEIDVSKAGQLI